MKSLHKSAPLLFYYYVNTFVHKSAHCTLCIISIISRIDEYACTYSFIALILLYTSLHRVPSNICILSFVDYSHSITLMV